MQGKKLLCKSAAMQKFKKKLYRNITFYVNFFKLNQNQRK